MIIINDDRRKTSVFLRDDPYLAHVVPENKTTQSVREHLSGTMELAEKNCPLKILKNIVICDTTGIIYKGRPGMNSAKEELAEITNIQNEQGSLADAMKNSDVFIGVSAPGVVTEKMVASMNDGAIVLAMANPIPEIMPDLAKKAGATIVGTGRSDFPNQINNVCAFPGIFRGALDVRASDINEEMKIAASLAIASLVSEEELSDEYIMPMAFDKRVGKTVAAAVAEAARKSGVARI